MKVVVIGIDGAIWDPILPYIDEGKLPGYSKFWKEGLHGPLTSTIPYLTQPAWKTYSMGKNPGKFGVYHWSKIDWKDFKIRNVNSLGFHGKDYWEILSEKGYRVSVIDMPSTSPPKKVNGVMISGMFHGDINGPWTYPEDYAKQVPSWFFKDRIHVFTSSEDPGSTMAGIEKEIKSRFDMAELLWDADLVHVSIIMNDHVSHFMWDNPEIMYRNFAANDDGITRILKENRDGYTILMSDHGNGPIEDEFYTNDYLESEGFLSLRERENKGMSRESVVNIGTKVGLDRVFKRLPNSMRGKVLARLKAIDSEMESEDLDNRIDWKETRVIALDEGLMWINPLYSDEREQIIEELRKKLGSIRSKTGKPLMKNIMLGNEVYWGPYAKDGPELVAICHEIYHQRYQLSGHIWASDIPKEKMGYRTVQVGHHRLKGIFGLVGPGVRPREMTASIYDLAPTILKLFNLDVPEDMDGHPLV